MPWSCTEVACTSNRLRWWMNGDDDNITMPSSDMSELPYSISYYSFIMLLHFARYTKESSVIWLSAKLSILSSPRLPRPHSISTAVSVIKLKFWERSIYLMLRRTVTFWRSLRDSYLILLFLKLKTSAFYKLLS